MASRCKTSNISHLTMGGLEPSSAISGARWGIRQKPRRANELRPQIRFYRTTRRRKSRRKHFYTRRVPSAARPSRGAGRRSGELFAGGLAGDYQGATAQHLACALRADCLAKMEALRLRRDIGQGEQIALLLGLYALRNDHDAAIAGEVDDRANRRRALRR